MNREKILQYLEGIEYNKKTVTEKESICRDIRIEYGIDNIDFHKISDLLW